MKKTGEVREEGKVCFPLLHCPDTPPTLPPLLLPPSSSRTHLKSLHYSPEVPIGLLCILVALEGHIPGRIVHELTRHDFGALLALEHRLWGWGGAGW